MLCQVVHVGQPISQKLLDQIYTLLCEVWPGWKKSSGSVIKELALTHTFYLLFDGVKLIGIALVHSLRYNIRMLSNFSIAEDFRGRGHGLQLLSFIQENERSCLLFECSPAMLDRFYRKVGARFVYQISEENVLCCLPEN